MDVNMFDTDSEDDMPPGWEEKVTEAGNMYYINLMTKDIQRCHPRTGRRRRIPEELPFGWRRVICSDGNVLFHDEIRNFRTTVDPRLAFAYYVKNDPFDIPFKFDAYTSGLEVLHGSNLSRRVAVVTGANSGIGFETARSLALYGCCVVFACRTMAKAEAAVRKVKSEQSYANCVPMVLDLASLKTVEEFVASFKSKFKTLNMLILNAAVFWTPYKLTEDSIESTFQICHLGHFYLTVLLEDIILNSSPVRIVVVSCESHRFSNLSLENMGDVVLAKSGKYCRETTYANAKLCNLLHANELHTRWSEKGVEVFAVHPGNLVYTNIVRNCWWFIKAMLFACKPFTKTAQQAASTSVFCATSHLLENASGIYLNNCFPCPPDTRCKDRQMAEKLWNISLHMVKYCKKE